MGSIRIGYLGVYEAKGPDYHNFAIGNMDKIFVEFTADDCGRQLAPTIFAGLYHPSRPYMIIVRSHSN